MQFAVSGCLFGTGPAAEVEYGPVQEAEDGHGVVVAFGEVFELAFEAEADAEFGTEAQPVNIAGAGDMVGAGAGDVTLPAPRSVAELGLVVAGHEPYCKPFEVVVAWDSGASFEVVVAWGCGVSFEIVFEPKAEFVLVAASEAEYMMAPCENIQAAPFEVLVGAQLGPTVVQPELLGNPETVEVDFGMETEPGSNPGGKVGVVQ